MNQLGKFNGVLLVSDFDDTLYGEDMRITRENVEALTYFTREGGTFTVATGRARPNFAPHASHIPINAPVILSNGSALYDFQADRMLEQTLLPPSAPYDFARLLELLPSLAVELYHGEDIYVWNPNPITDAHMAKVGTDYTVCPIQEAPLPWTKAIFQQDRSVLLQAQSWLKEHGVTIEE